MEGSDGRRAESERRARTPGTVGSLARFTVLGAALLLGGDARRPATERPAAPANAATEEAAPDSPYEHIADLPPGTALVGRHLRIVRDGREDLLLSVRRRDGALELAVNGKEYAVQDSVLLPNVSIGRAIDAVDLQDGFVRLLSAEFGDVDVPRAEVERVLDLLDASESPVVSASVNVHFRPKEGTPLAAGIAMRRMWNGWKEGDPESYEIGCVRKNPPVTMAMRDRD